MIPDNNRIAPIAMRRMPGQFASSPKNPTPRRRGSRVPRTGRPESGPLSDPRQITARTMYKTPPRTSSAPSPIRNIFASQFIAAPHNRTGINRGKVGFVPAGITLKISRIGNRPSVNARPARPWPSKPPAGQAEVVLGGASFFSLQLPSSPMVVFAIGVEDALDAAVQGLHDTDAREHRRAARYRDQDQGFH